MRELAEQSDNPGMYNLDISQLEASIRETNNLINASDRIFASSDPSHPTHDHFNPGLSETISSYMDDQGKGMVTSLVLGYNDWANETGNVQLEDVDMDGFTNLLSPSNDRGRNLYETVRTKQGASYDPYGVFFGLDASGGGGSGGGMTAGS